MRKLSVRVAGSRKAPKTYVMTETGNPLVLVQAQSVEGGGREMELARYAAAGEQMLAALGAMIRRLENGDPLDLEDYEVRDARAAIAAAKGE